jgi:hypothetical protein
MSRDEAEPEDGKPGEDGDGNDDSEADDATDAGTAHDDTGDGTDSASPSDGGSGRDEFGVASDVVTGRSESTGGADRAESSDPADRAGDDDDTVEPTDTGGSEPTDSDSELIDGGSEPTDGDSESDAPLSSLASSVSERRNATDERPEDELFDEEDVEQIDADVVWERLGEDEPPDVPEDTEHDVRVIEKRSYCEQCPFFSTPPDVSCENEGTEILELVDMDHFRVVDCPKVLEDERLERI